MIVVGSFWFIVFIGIVLITGILSSYMNSFFFGTITFLGTVLGLQYIFDVPIWETVKYNPLLLAVSLVVFVIVGLIYSYAWELPETIKENKKDIQDQYTRYMKNYPTNTMDDYLESEYYQYKASDLIPDIAAWTLLWPFHLLVEVLHKPAKYIFNKVYSTCAVLFEAKSISTAKSLNLRNSDKQGN